MNGSGFAGSFTDFILTAFTHWSYTEVFLDCTGKGDLFIHPNVYTFSQQILVLGSNVINKERRTVENMS